MGLLSRLGLWRDPPPPRRRTDQTPPFVYGPGAVTGPTPPFIYGPGAIGGGEGLGRGTVADLQPTLINGAVSPDNWRPPPAAPRRGFEPASAPMAPAAPAASQLRVAPSPQARQGALADMEAQAAGPWTERPEGFLPGIGWDLREMLIQRQMERMRGGGG